MFGGTSKTEKRPASSSHKVAKASSHAAEKSQASKATVISNEVTVEKTNHAPPPDLLDLGEPTATTDSAPSVDPFKQLEGLLDTSQVTSTANHGAVSATETPDIIGLYTKTPASFEGSRDEASLPGLLDASSNTASAGATLTTQLSKGPNAKDSIEKDALVRQVGVTPSSQNPNLFRDLLG